MYEQFYRGYQPMPQLTQYQPPSADERIWVQNETAADSYLIAPNGFVRLWDASCNRFYEKRADATGRPLPMDVYEYTKMTFNEPIKEKEEVADYKKQIADLEARIEALEQKGQIKNAKRKPDADDTDVQ